MRGITIFIIFFHLSLGSFQDTQSAVSKIQDDFDVCVEWDATINTTSYQSLNRTSKLCVFITQLPEGTGFILFQAHTQRYNVTLSYIDNPVIKNQAIEGTALGLVSLIDRTYTGTFYLFNKNENNVLIMLSLILYDNNSPVPGGCNMEFPIEISPFLRLNYQHGLTTLEFQHANFGSLPNMKLPLCSFATDYIGYSVYVRSLEEEDFGEESYFAGLEAMRNVDSIRSHATHAYPYITTPRTRASFATYPGQGVIYVVIASYDVNGTVYESAYVPITTYGCSFDSQIDGCGNLTRTFGKIFAVFISIFGLMVALRGHRYLILEMTFFGFLSLALVSFVLLTKYSSLNNQDREVITMLCGLCGALLWYFVWWYYAIPVLSVLLVGLNLGFFLTAVIYFTPIGNDEILRNDFNYWNLLLCGMLFTTVVLLPATKLLSILACTIIGTYAFMIVVDRYIGTTLSYIILNVVKRAVVDDFNLSVNQVPFHKNDIVLSVIWIILAFLLTIFQLYSEKGRAPFPSAPRIAWRRRRDELRRKNSQLRRISRPTTLMEEDESAPLLVANTAAPNYASI